MEKEKFGTAVISFLQEYYSKHNKIPSTATLFKSFNKTKFYEVFPQGLAQACRTAGTPVPEERLRRTQKALRATSKKRVEEVSPLQDLKQSHEIQQREEQRRKEFAEKRAEEDAILLQDSNEAISRPVLDAMEKTALPILLKKKYGIDASVAEILEMLKQYEKAVDEGWCVEYAMEWGILSEEEREAFRELCTKAYSEEGVSPTRYLVTLKGAMENLKGRKDQLSTEIGELNQEKRDLDWSCSLAKAQLDKLENDHEERKKQLDGEYYKKGREYAFQFSMIKRQEEDEINRLKNERERLKTECENLEKEKSKIVDAAKQRCERIDIQIAEGHTELERLRSLVGPKGTVSDLAKHNEELKAQLAEKDRQLAEKAMEVAGKWLNQEEAIQEAEGVYRFVLDEVERRINAAGPALYVLEFLESELPDEEFRELTFAINLAQVKRESQNPDNPYFADLPLKKGKLSGAFPDSIEEYKRMHNEKMERLEGQRGIMLNQIRRDAMGFEIAAHTIFGLLDEVLKPLAEAYFNPKEPRQTTPANSDGRE